MAKNIAVSDEVYSLLSKLKLPGESFSEVIKRIIKRGGKLTDLVGKKTITKEEWSRVEDSYTPVKELEIERKEKLIKKIQE